MLEILLLIWIYSALSKRARAKGLSGAWGLLGVGLWIGGEIFGFLTGAAVTQDAVGAYIFAIIGAVFGAMIAFLIVMSLAPSANVATAALGDVPPSPPPVGEAPVTPAPTVETSAAVTDPGAPTSAGQS